MAGMRHIAIAAALLCLPAGVPGQRAWAQQAGAQQMGALPAGGSPVQAHYAAYSTGLNVLRLDAEMAVGPRDYRVRLTYRTAGTLRAFVQSDADTVAEGQFVGDRPTPRRFISQGSLRGRPRATQIEYIGGQPQVRALTPPNDEEREPVPVADQAGTIDSLSAMAQLMRQVNATGRCEGRSRTYDGRRLAELSARTAGQETLEPTSRSSFAGPALRCDFEGRQLAGFMLDGDRAAAQRPQRASAWFAATALGGPMIPVRMQFETRFVGNVTMYLAAPN